MWEIILPFLGFLIGIVAAMTGVGGGIFIVPLLTLTYSFSPANAVGTSLTTITFTAVAATLSYSRQKRIFYKGGILLAVATAPGAVLGAYLTSVVPAMLLGLIFGVFLILVAIRIVFENGFKKRKKPEEAELRSEGILEKDLLANKNHLAIGLVLGFFGGVTSGLLGIGGGVVIVPVMTLVLSMSVHYAVATSMLTMIVTSAAGVGQHFVLGNINFEFALLLAVGSVLGAQVGTYVSKRLSDKSLRRVFALVLLVVSIQMILKFI
jgi:uncharacterized protein